MPQRLGLTLPIVEPVLPRSRGDVLACKSATCAIRGMQKTVLMLHWREVLRVKFVLRLSGSDR